MKTDHMYTGIKNKIRQSVQIRKKSPQKTQTINLSTVSFHSYAETFQ
uniref:Uncharacterized protein n=1 Tax=Anguilla anguilla TaxID=7936 RepID=A0A0E9WS76_ANGAN